MKIPMISSLAASSRSSNSRLLLSTLAFAAIFVFSLCLLFAPRWETNDDVAMSMIAHGYGIAPMGSPNILFSNVIWGHLVRAIPELNGILGYSIATLSVLVIVATALLYGLLRLGVNRVSCLSILALTLVRPVLFPQFTINSGLLMMGAIICWHLYAQKNDRKSLVAGYILACFSYLVRSQEFFLVLIVALPLLPYRKLFLQRTVRIIFLIFVSAIAISAAIDHQAYQGDEWKTYNELNPVRALFTDFGAGAFLKQRSDILQRHGYSINDINLIENWFFVDSHIADPKNLQVMIKELGPLPSQKKSLINAWIGMQTLWHPFIVLPMLSALLLAVFRPSWQVATSWGLCIAAAFALGLLGRHGVLRVYVPLICLLLVAPFLNGQVSGWRNYLGIVILFVAAVINASHVFQDSKTFQIADAQVRDELATFPDFPVVIWAATFPYEAVYPVLGTTAPAMSYLHYGLGTSTLAPFTVAYKEQKEGNGLTDLLTKEKGIPIMANPKYFEYLEIYCKERLHGQLKELFVKNYGAIEVSQRQCAVVNL